MGMLVFMPWCRIDKDYRVGQVSIAPYRSEDEAATGLDRPALDAVRTILSCYRDLEARPVRHAALIRYEDRPLLADLAEPELEVTYEHAELACFSGLARRELFNPAGGYCNADCFILDAQRFEQLDHVAVTSRRRDGRTWNVRELAATIFSEPVHTSPVQRVSLDADLLRAVVDFRAAASAEEWGRWQNAISCFNQANTDNDTVRYQTEWALMAAAFERILEAAPNAENMAERLKATIVPSASLLIRDARRRGDRMRDMMEVLRYEWMKEFYRIRGGYAHGRLDARQPVVWQPLEHLVLAAIAFPLVLRSLLRSMGRYALTDDDVANIDAFEHLADADFLRLPADACGSTDSVWARLLREARMDGAKRKAVATLGGFLESQRE